MNIIIGLAIVSMMMIAKYVISKEKVIDNYFEEEF